jgi:hypothetical protein
VEPIHVSYSFILVHSYDVLSPFLE